MLERRSRKPDRSIILLVLIILVVVASGIYAYLQLRVDQITDALKKKLPLNTLFIFFPTGRKPCSSRSSLHP